MKFLIILYLSRNTMYTKPEKDLILEDILTDSDTDTDVESCDSSIVVLDHPGEDERFADAENDHPNDENAGLRSIVVLDHPGDDERFADAEDDLPNDVNTKLRSQIVAPKPTSNKRRCAGRGRGRGRGQVPPACDEQLITPNQPVMITNSTETMTNRTLYRKADLAFSFSDIPGPVLMKQGSHIFIANKVDEMMTLLREEKYLILYDEARGLLTPCFNAIENAHGPRHTGRAVERQRYNLKCFVCPILTTLKFINSNQHAPKFLLQPTLDLLKSLIERLLIMNDEKLY